ncbi:MAG: toll/interleukin-1 receptor domain-containing protein [Vicinamibacterales bacterium]
MSAVLVAGTSRPFDRLARRAARMVASTLVENGFNLVTGNATGVDKAVSASFCFELQRRGADVAKRYTQLRLPFGIRGSFWPVAGYRAPASTRLRLARMHDWLEEARTRADAAVMIGGHGGTQGIVDRFMDAGKPVFPVPFTGGCSNDVFRDILRNWCDNPVPGLSKSQFLRLAVPWIAGTGSLADLLLGTLSSKPDIFISYRRDDSEWITGRLRRDLAEHFGTKRVFMDLEHIEPGQSWAEAIASAVKESRVGIVVIGADWFESGSFAVPRLLDERDVLRHEIRTLLASGKPILIVMTPDAPAPHLWRLPADLARLSQIQAVTITTRTWDLVMDQIIRTIKPILRRPAEEAPSQAGGGQEPAAPAASLGVGV